MGAISLSLVFPPLPLADGLVRHVEPGGQILLGQAQGPALAADEITQPLFVHGRSPRVQSTPAGGIWQPTSGREGCLLPQGLFPRGMRLPFSFWSCPKRECAAPGGREKGAWRASVQLPSARRGSAYRCLLRFGLVFGHAILFCEIDTSVPWRMAWRSSGWSSH